MCFQGPCPSSTRSNGEEALTNWMFSGGLVSGQLAQTMQNHSPTGCVFRGPCKSLTRSNDVEPLTNWMRFQRPCQSQPARTMKCNSQTRGVCRCYCQRNKHGTILNQVPPTTYIHYSLDSLSFINSHRFSLEMSSISISCFYHLGYHIHTKIINIDNSLFEATATTLTS